MNMPGGGIEPFYFGTPGKALFGCYHAPQPEGARDCGVVLCYPMGREYISSHRAYQQLAVRLSTVGFHVLRFDFFGCGDSSGDCEQGQINQWLSDITAAVSELRGRCGLTKVCLAGVRLGGTLSLMAGVERGDIESMVLWDPIVRGKSYLEELTTSNQEMLKDSRSKPNRCAMGKEYVEILGFPFPKSMLSDLAEIDLLSIRQKPANDILIIESNEEASGTLLWEHLIRIDANVEYLHLPGPKVWIDYDDPIMHVLGPRRIPNLVVSWISQRHL